MNPLPQKVPPLRWFYQNMLSNTASKIPLVFGQGGLCFILPLIPCLVTQVLGLHEEIVFGSLNVDGLCHLFIMVDIPIVYVAARKWGQ